MVDLNARIYDPTIGRFLSADDVVPDQYGPQTLNRYSYVHNNPLSFTDPSGHDCTICEGFKPSFSDKELASQNSIAMSDCWGSCGGLGTAAGESMFSHSSSQGTAGVSGGAPSALTQATSNKSEGAPITGTAPQTSSGTGTTGNGLDRNAEAEKEINRGNNSGSGNYEQPIEQVTVTGRQTPAQIDYRDLPSPQFTNWPVPGFPRLNLNDKPGEGGGTFGVCRGTGCTRRHMGIDIQAPEDVPAIAVGDGTVVAIPSDPNGYGNQVIIDHGNGVKTRSAHLNSVEVTVGERVKAGQEIGTVGKTGNPPPLGDSHLHFEILVNGVPVDPLPHLPQQPPDAAATTVPFRP
jgi:murein DD-endopeptidase MepM/ murein hydrolase activator NlpD